MKKLLTIALALVMALSLTAIPAFAATPFDGVDKAPNKIYGATYDATTATGEVPVYGYVGEAKNVVDNGTDPDGDGIKTDPENPNLPPSYVPYLVNVSVPTKIIWAAFETDKGVITAPEYKIVNNSLKNNLNVTLVSFTAGYTGYNNGDTAANTVVDKDLTLNIAAPAGDTSSPFAQEEVVKGTDQSVTYFGSSPANSNPIKDGSNNNAVLAKATKSEQGEVTTHPWNFTIGGSYTGSFTTEYHPTYTMTLKFEVVTPTA
jgi:hypothetical protein